MGMCSLKMQLGLLNEIVMQKSIRMLPFSLDKIDFRNLGDKVGNAGEDNVYS